MRLRIKQSSLRSIITFGHPSLAVVFNGEQRNGLVRVLCARLLLLESIQNRQARRLLTKSTALEVGLNTVLVHPQ